MFAKQQKEWIRANEKMLQSVLQEFVDDCIDAITDEEVATDTEDLISLQSVKRIKIFKKKIASVARDEPQSQDPGARI